MSSSDTRELELESTGRYVAFDASTGEVLLVRETLSERGSCGSTAEARDIESVRQAARDVFAERNVKAVRLPQNFVWNPEATYRMDPASEELRELPPGQLTFREFVRHEQRAKDEYP